MKTEIIVKENSIVEFFKQNLCNYNEQQIKRMSCDGNVNAYNLLQDNLYLKKSSEISVGQDIYIEISDESRCSNTSLINKYQYHVKDYDDISYIAVLVNFTIKIK